MAYSFLIVEDDPFIAMDLELAIEEAGYKVLAVAGSVDEAYAALSSSSPDYAILDFNLGHEDSLPIAKDLDTKRVPFIFVTGRGPQLRKEAPQYADRILSKPVDVSRILSAFN
ncbi:response regulator [Robiginitomaculum antarcticum]|uniref:response regulator n=1 Tax=Robiginitomaculum antarcticum TaxID=437507 RepID=UPI0003829FED|nr:response regulator [Robiginitomaculum antarcticum]